MPELVLGHRVAFAGVREAIRTDRDGSLSGFKTLDQLLRHSVEAENR